LIEPARYDIRHLVTHGNTKKQQFCCKVDVKTNIKLQRQKNAAGLTSATLTRELIINPGLTAVNQTVVVTQQHNQLRNGEDSSAGATRFIHIVTIIMNELSSDCAL
jgi:hypothetical protein